MTGASLSHPRHSRGVQVIEPPRIGLWRQLVALWRHWRLALHFGARYVERRYARTLLGWLWVPLRPAADVAGRVLLFGGFLGVASGDRPYFMFFIVGFAAWMLFDRTAFWATRAIELNRRLLGRVAVPQVVAVEGAIVPGLVDFLLFLVIGLIGATYYKVVDGAFYLSLTPVTAWAVIGIGLLAIWGFAIGLFTAPIAARARDIRFLSRYIFGFWFLLTPVVYPISLVPERYQGLATYNPITPPVEMVKYGLLDTAPPSETSVVVSLSVLALLLIGGFLFMARYERGALERL